METLLVTFRLRYHTWFGQELSLCSDDEWLGGGQPAQALPMRYLNEDFWEITLHLPKPDLPGKPVSYYYRLRQPDGELVTDFGNDRKLDLAGLPRGGTIIMDSWNDLGAIENIFSTEPFKKILLHAEPEGACPKPLAGATHWFHVKAPLLPNGQTICLLGGMDTLGGWEQSKPVLLHRDAERGGFHAQIALPAGSFSVDYKYGVFDLRRNEFLRYEDGPNRVLAQAAPPEGRVCVQDGFARLPHRPWRGAGVAIPVFSLRSQRSFGVGEFLDLPLLADWAGRAGLKLIQILPVNDTSATHTRTDSYPYAGISACALHPLYLNLDRMAGAGPGTLLKELALQRQCFNLMEVVDYEAVMKSKLAFVRRIFSAQRQTDLAGVEYREFFARNKHWLVPYAAFCLLRDRFKTADFNRWPEHRVCNSGEIDELAARDSTARDEMELHYFIQFHLHLQLREAADYLHDKGLVLKGDLAIGVHPHAVDVWQHPELFHADMQAGAPPDAFSAKGQNWGFPTYNWPRMKEDGFAWWKRRMIQMSCYFDAFRIDHILGFFRIWSIPRDAVEGILGYFVPAVPVRIGEFAARGIAFDRQRFAQPFINDAVLVEVFGDRAEEVRRRFLDVTRAGEYALKAAFSTQRAVKSYFATRRDARLQEGLFDLISNVLLIEAPGEAFHFRLSMEQTPSFRQLDAATQGGLRELSEDYFYRRQDDFWRREGLQKLPALKRVTNMLVCGEDLGMIPACVPEVMRQLALLSLEIQRMPKALGAEFSRPAEAPYLSVVTPSTHDMSTIRGWWREDKNVTQKFFNEELRRSGQAPTECEPWINREIVRQHIESPAMWSIFQLQDLLGMDPSLRRADADAERINVPAECNHNWCYRLHLPLEELTQARHFTRLMEDVVRQGGR